MPGKISRVQHLSLALTLAMAGACDHGSTAPEPLDVEVCAVIASPQLFDGKTVRMRVRWITDHHGAFLTDFPCRYRGIAVTEGIALRSDDKKLLDDTIYSREVQDRTHDFTATLTGVFRWNNPAIQGPPTYMDWVSRQDHPPVLEVTKVTAVRIVPSTFF